ncbi:MAG: HAMP domain-containing histidine kinase [Bacteroidetes bacterium]|nr:HAMP domain-containing histidine kinase [Rhodothermia bacterium]MCS7155652.1 HAMP domain-containing histidine kinase [Bacteroidota bacterium]MCX7906511.1 HAMP domain-containing histidine kinase [Bacteroidota bacterium]MDW8137208.1 HAMP domain-containing sensor histidine kinase [Bacteroidota bacterium]MDW8284922.1 HAMP domain-containing sensor histidine kinase [Bacteroidota bacterium]
MSRLSRRSLTLLGLMALSILASLYLALQELRTSAHLAEEVERGLRSDGEFFLDRLSRYTEELVYDQNLRRAVESESYLIQTSSGPVFGFDYTYSIPNLVEYAFYIDLREGLVYTSDPSQDPKEVLAVFSIDTLLAQVPDLYPYILRGVRQGPKGPFHYVYLYAMVGEHDDFVVKGVKINPQVVLREVIPRAYARLQELVRTQRGRFPDEYFELWLYTPYDTLRLSPRSRNLEYTNVYRAGFDPAGGLFSNWILEVRYRNRLAAEGLFRYVRVFIPALVLILALLLVYRMATREMELARLKADFVSNVSHELKTPLAKIRFFAEMLRLGRARTSERRTQYLQIIEQECERLTRLVDNVLDFARIERGHLRYDMQPVELRALLDQVLRTFGTLYQSRGYKLRAEWGPDLPATIEADAGALTQALVNLIDNAVKYSEPHEIRVRLERANGHVRISVHDQGIGIPKEQLPYIFRSFYRIETGLAQRASGSGLGLAVVEHIVQAHRGRIEVESELGRGSTFTLVLPISQRKTTAGS